MVDLLAQFTQSVPLVTRCCLLFSCVLMAAVSLDVLSPYALFFSPRRVFREYEVWRIFTSIFFFGDFSVHFFWCCYMMVLYSSKLEDEAFRNRTSDFCWMIFILVILTVIFASFFTKTLFLSGALINALTYIWGRKNPYSRVTIIFFSVYAHFLPWVLAILSAVIGNRVLDHLLGILVGHIFFFFDDVFPLMPISKGVRIVSFPLSLLKRHSTHGHVHVE